MTTLFPPAEGPRVFALPPGADFARALAQGLDARLAGQPPEAVARVEIWLNTRRAARTLQAVLAAGPARLLPRIRTLAELADDPLTPALPPAVPALRRQLELARLVARLAEAEPHLAAGTAAFELAGSLAELLDEMQGEGLDPAAFARVDPAEHAAHWQRSLRFLTLISPWLAAAGPAAGQGRLRAAAQALARVWAADPPRHPVIVAGSTGSRGATRAFMAAVARLPQGALVLPGLDPDLPPQVWDRLGADDPGAADHPQHGFRALADALGFDPAAVPFWHPAPAPAPERNALVSLALRPAPVTDQWQAEGAALAGRLAPALASLAWVEAPDQRAEALAIALALREAVETGTRAALVTPDRQLARRVTAELDRWGLIPDDSAGRPLSLTPPGVLLRRLAALPGERLSCEDLLVLLKHPLVMSAPGARRDHRRLTARLERRRLRGRAPWIDWPALAGWAATEGGAAPAWIGWLEATLAPLADAGAASLAEHVARHRAAAEALAAGPSAEAGHGLWEQEAGLRARALLDALAAESEAAAPLDAQGYRSLLQAEMAARDVPEPPQTTHPGLAIWGTLEARIQSADLVVLGGLNEGTWPRPPGADPWLGRPLRRAIGLPSPDRRIGLSAHDFQQAMGAPRVLVTRATRDAEAPTVPSRWLLRLENLLLGLGEEGRAALEAARARGAALAAQAARLDEPAASLPHARRPSPRPPAAARPRELSVTQVERLVRDPYGIYAQKVLRLRRLDPPGREPDALARGTAIHKALDDFVTATLDGLPEDAGPIFFATVRAALATEAPWPAVNAIWTARLARAARWFLAGEALRRARGTPLAREVKGRREVEGLAQPFAVTARADRIDRVPGGLALYDYKSGTGPSPKEAAAFHLQLHLEAAIAEAGGFEGVPAAPARHLELLKLGRTGETLALDPDPEKWRRFKALIAHYQDEANGFPARLRPQKLTWGSDYDHLSRRGEWADGDEPEESW
ncbi:MAG TPA: double-strand break repair protein AddB [Amaricoccus sp.]|nr:double-strand break repair protein AddB [Amaricoccus sp.]